MGAAISTYEGDRRRLRRALILSVIENPENKDLLSKITGLRKLVVQHAEICATAAREAAHKFDYSPTSMDAAWHELDRLFTVYDTGRILKTAKMRKGPVACPLGHHAVGFDKVADHPLPKPAPRCGICESKIKTSGYYCSYCNYNVCNICSVVYCSYGHVMVLWTHEESDHDCAVCRRHPIHSGYRCTTCPHYDLCDYCTFKEGRQAVAEVIIARMEQNLQYMRDHMAESATAAVILRTMKKTVGVDGYSTILHLVQFAQSVADSRNKVREEVILTRVTKEVERFRAIVCSDPDISATHARESARPVVYTIEEAARLRVLVDSHFMAKSVSARSGAAVACPLGHAAFALRSLPSVYTMRALEGGATGSTSLLPPYCKICSLLADGGNHCAFCEYDLCQTCSVLYCSEGHVMVMWTIPEARAQRCYVCHQPELTAGYHCSKCFVSLCDMCSRKERRLDVREKWENELRAIMAFMYEHRKRSDMARYYQWRNVTVIKALGALCEYVRELRVAKRKAEKQIKYKGIIDKMKVLNADICADADFSATSARESKLHTGPDGYYFASKREARQELDRLKAIIDLSRLARSVDARQTAGIACVLGHAMVHLRHSSQDPHRLEPEVEPEAEPEPEPGEWEESFASSIKKSAPRKGKSGRASPAPSPLPPASSSSSSRKAPASLSSLATVPPHTPVSPSSSGLSTGSFRSPVSHTPASPEAHEGEAEEEVAEAPWDPDLVVYLDSAQCRACLKDALAGGGGRTCLQCDYHLCSDCQVVSCRMGHVAQIWTSYDAFEVSCDLCSKANLTMGYRCQACAVDVCDRCTRRDVRETLKLWPKREIRKQLLFMESMRADSDEAKRLVARTQAFLSNEAEPSVAALARMLADLEVGKTTVDAEIVAKKKQIEAARYSAFNVDF